MKRIISTIYFFLQKILILIKSIWLRGKITDNENYLIYDRYFIKKGKAKIFAEDSNYLIIIPNTIKALLFYSNNTEWLLYDHNKKNIKKYLTNGDIYIIIDKNLLNTNSGLKRLFINFNIQKGLIIDFNYNELNSDIKKDYINFFKNKTPNWFYFKYDVVYRYINGRAIIKRNDKYGIINISGEELTDIKYDTISNYNEGKARAMINDKWGFIDISGKETIPFKYDYVWDFFGKKSDIKLNDKYGTIDEIGNESWI